MKKITLLMLIYISVTMTGYGQIFIDKDGNIHDQRKTATTTTRTTTTTKSEGFKFDKSKLTFGGNFGLQFGDYTVINVAPQVGYNFTKYFSLGTGLGYTYYKEDYGVGEYSRHYLSYNIYGRIYPLQTFVIGVQPEISRMWEKETIGRNTYDNNEFVPSVLVGIGFRYSGMIAMLQYDVIQNKNTPYGNSIFYSVGYGFNF